MENAGNLKIIACLGGTMVIVVGILVAGLLVVGALGYAVHRHRERAWARIREEQMRRLKKAEEGVRRGST